MEIVFGLIILFFGGFIIRGLSAGAKSVVSGQSIKESYRGLDDFKVQFNDSRFEGDILRKNIQIKGEIPVSYTTDVSVCISVFDVESDGTKLPLFSFLDIVQEPNSSVFRHTNKIGNVDSGSGFKDWVDVLTLVPSLLQPPKSGNRKIEVFFYMYNTHQAPAIQNGIVDPEDVAKLLTFETLTFNHVFSGKGYLEVSEDIEEANELTIKIAMAVAMSDGSLDDNEGLVIKNWVKKTIAPYQDDRKKELKDLYNKAMKSGYALATKGKLNYWPELTTRLNEINEPKTKYDTLELCYEVMAADGVANDNELKLIKTIADALDLDLEEVNKLRDKNLINLQKISKTSTNFDQLLGINPNWDTKQINAHLLSEFTKWNNRLSTLSEGKERENAQMMLNGIAEARKKNGS